MSGLRRPFLFVLPCPALYDKKIQKERQGHFLRKRFLTLFCTGKGKSLLKTKRAIKRESFFDTWNHIEFRLNLFVFQFIRLKRKESQAKNLF